MQIVQSRIRNLNKYRHILKDGMSILLAVPLKQISPEKIESIGFNSTDPGITLLPKPIGPVSEYNAEGKFISHKDQPKETAYRQAEWTWTEFRGRYDTVEKSKIVDIPYQRYPRTFSPPPSIELTIRLDTNGDKTLATTPFIFQTHETTQLIHAINLLLELFGFCELLHENLESILDIPVRRLNWDILPKGNRPWSSLKPLLDKKISQLPDGVKTVIDKRFESINIHKPDFVAVGRAGFSGYVVFGFPQKGIFILESTQTNNATYVFDSNWEELSNMTKLEILNERLHKNRVLHRESWFANINRILN
jgi:hypothetical protein